MSMNVLEEDEVEHESKASVHGNNSQRRLFPYGLKPFAENRNMRGRVVNNLIECRPETRNQTSMEQRSYMHNLLVQDDHSTSNEYNMRTASSIKGRSPTLSNARNKFSLQS